MVLLTKLADSVCNFPYLISPKRMKCHFFFFFSIFAPIFLSFGMSNRLTSNDNCKRLGLIYDLQNAHFFSHRIVRIYRYLVKRNCLIESSQNNSPESFKYWYFLLNRQGQAQIASVSHLEIICRLILMEKHF